jgi:hypothetical protein
VLLGRGTASAHDAFATLAAAARQTSRPVEEVARALLAEVLGRAPDPPPRSVPPL